MAAPFYINDVNGNTWQVTIAADGSLQTTQVAPQQQSGSGNPNSNRTVQQVINWARTQAKLLPLVGVGGLTGAGSEPALSIANNVMQEILQPPYNWKWNRFSYVPTNPSTNTWAFQTVEYSQDYAMASSDAVQIGWIESALVEDGTSTQPIPYRNPMTVSKDLAATSDYGNPEKLAWWYDSSYNAWWRVWPIPVNTIWNIYPIYQIKAPIITTVSQTWAPIPDQLAYVVNQGFLAMTFRHAEDSRADVEYQKFQMMIQKALGNADAEMPDQTFYPERPIMIG